MSLEITDCRNVLNGASTDVDGIPFGSAANMPPYTYDSAIAEKLSPRLQILARAIDRRLDVSLMRGAFETPLARSFRCGALA